VITTILYINVRFISPIHLTAVLIALVDLLSSSSSTPQLPRGKDAVRCQLLQLQHYNDVQVFDLRITYLTVIIFPRGTKVYNFNLGCPRMSAAERLVSRHE
jgi:hypothetical protein